MPQYPVIEFHQFESGSDSDKLLLFAAPAREIIRWAGIPRKGWHVRMLYQRWITERREMELKDFWTNAAKPPAGQPVILGPTAITVGIFGDPKIADGKIDITYEPQVDLRAPAAEKLRTLAGFVRKHVYARLPASDQALVGEFELEPRRPLPDTSHDYVLEFALQLTQMAAEPDWFQATNEITALELDGLIEALEAVCRPALVVDGQHRLVGAALADVPVWLPTVAFAKSSWMDQIYQFIVINEKAQRVEGSLLTDIFGSSLTRREQDALRLRLERARVDVEARIAAVIAGRDPESPFLNMVQLRLSTPPPANAKPYITDKTIRLLIDGDNRREARGWRSDDDFYEAYIRPTFPERGEWDNWASGKWRQYWFTFWKTVASYYDTQAQVLLKIPDYRLWNPIEQTNLTKAVALRHMQRLFIVKATERMRELQRSKPILVEALGEAVAEEKMALKERELGIPASLEGFQTQVREWFLEKGVPVRFFTAQWQGSLDDEQGRTFLWDEMEKAFDKRSRGERYKTQNQNVFRVRDEEDP